MALIPGTRLGPYEILSALGAGGMGEVYRARDTKLKRDVAIKILPESFANDPDRLARFQREAEVLASLNHPHIAAIYGLEEARDGSAPAFLVMELVEGDDLSQRISRGPTPIDEAMPIAKQIAAALEAAHDQGIIHRDLKPANIKITPDGIVKVLDFGLAKLALPDSSRGEPDVTASPTIASPATMTGSGVVMGTAAYMSPEQAKGKPADKRSDIWSFGAVVYELLTGGRAFEGESVVETLNAVISKEPNWTPVPRSAQALLHWCLEKDRKKRLQAIGDARRLLDEAGQPLEQSHVSMRPRLIPRYAAWVMAALFLVTTIGVSILHFREDAPAKPAAVRFQIAAPGNDIAEMFRLSPDGRLLVFVDSSRNQLWIRPLDSLDARVLAGTDGASYPFWSPDGAYLGFFAQGKLKKISVAGGPVQTLCDAADGRGATWNREGAIVFSPGPVGVLYQLSETGGAPAPVTKVASSGEGHRFPEFLPDGRHFFYVIQSPKRPEASGVYVGALDGHESVRLLPDVSSVAYAAPSASSGGLLLFRREDTLMAQSFDEDHLQIKNDIFPVAEQVGTTGHIGVGAFAVAGGVLVYRGARGASRELVWIDRTGKRSAPVTKAFRDDQAFSSAEVALSPDEKQSAFAAVDRSDEDLWLLNFAQGMSRRLTFGPGGSGRPIWSPDGRRLVFSRVISSTSANYELYERPASGGTDQLFLRPDGVINVNANDWSPDGKWILYSATSEKTSGDLWLVSTDAARRPIPYLQTPASEVAGRFSPVGQWIAYVSNEFGQNQVFVNSIPAGDKRQISTAGGGAPRWRGDGQELFYAAPNHQLMAVPVRTADNFEFGTPVPLPIPVTIPLQAGNALTGGYAPTHDGQRFLVNVPAGGEGATAPPITVVLNWTTALKK